MKVFVKPTGTYSRAMVRIADALARYAPPSVTITTDRGSADLVVLYVIGPDAIAAGRSLFAAGKRYVAVQCCWRSTGVSDDDWLPFWHDADLVMSYYQLPAIDGVGENRFNFYHAPLGIDDIFKQPCDLSPPRDIALTTGFVHGGSAEAIEEFWIAARRNNLRTVHIGPHNVVGTADHADVHCQPSDEELAALYRQARFVGACRYVEGFELPAYEGVACGAQPIMFRQPSVVRWGWELAALVPELSGAALADRLTETMIGLKKLPIIAEQRELAIHRFNWATICRGFWERVGL